MTQDTAILRELQRLTKLVEEAANKPPAHPKKDNMEWNYETNRYEWNGEPPECGMW
jgi:hypothetical protein